jgi:hypothetical protein
MLSEILPALPVSEAADRKSFKDILHGRLGKADNYLNGTPESPAFSTNYLIEGKIRLGAGGLIYLLTDIRPYYSDQEIAKEVIKDISEGGFVEGEDKEMLVRLYQHRDLGLIDGSTINSKEVFAKLALIEQISDRLCKRMVRENQPLYKGDPSDHTARRRIEEAYAQSITAACNLSLQVQYVKGVLTGDPRITADSLFKLVRDVHNLGYTEVSKQVLSGERKLAINLSL